MLNYLDQMQSELQAMLDPKPATTALEYLQGEMATLLPASEDQTSKTDTK